MILKLNQIYKKIILKQNDELQQNLGYTLFYSVATTHQRIDCLKTFKILFWMKSQRERKRNVYN